MYIPPVRSVIALPFALDRLQAIIRGMTPAERDDPKIINASRRLRIAKGSGTPALTQNYSFVGQAGGPGYPLTPWFTVTDPAAFPMTQDGFQRYLDAVGVRHFSAREMLTPNHPDKAAALGVDFAEAAQLISTAMGSAYVGKFTNQGWVQNVWVQAEQQHRMSPDDVLKLNARNSVGEMVPLSSFVSVDWTRGPRARQRHHAACGPWPAGNWVVKRTTS